MNATRPSAVRQARCPAARAAFTARIADGELTVTHRHVAGAGHPRRDRHRRADLRRRRRERRTRRDSDRVRAPQVAERPRRRRRVHARDPRRDIGADATTRCAPSRAAPASSAPRTSPPRTSARRTTRPPSTCAPRPGFEQPAHEPVRLGVGALPGADRDHERRRVLDHPVVVVLERRRAARRPRRARDAAPRDLQACPAAAPRARPPDAAASCRS